MSDFLEAAPLWLPGSVAMICLIVVSGFFSGSETALFYLSRDELRALRIGRPRERSVAGLLRDPDRLLTAILFWNLVINLTFFAVSVVTARRLIRNDLAGAAGLFVLASLAAVIVFGEVIPKGVAVLFRRRIAVLVGIPLGVAVRVLDPVLPALSGSARMLRRAFWPGLKPEPYLEVEDLERAIETSKVGVELIHQEQRVLRNILELSEISVEEVMRPRGTYTLWRPPVHLEDIRGRLGDTEYLLIQDDGPDAVAGAVPLSTLAALPERNLEQLAEDVLHVPWCARLAAVLQEMRARLVAVAAVVNEYGETTGIVTYDDILDTVLTCDASRTRRVLGREPVLEVAPGCYHVDGMTTLRYLSQRLNVEYEPAADGLVTVSGLLHEALQRLPVTGDECRWNEFRIKVIDAEHPRRLRVMVDRGETTDER